MLRYRHRFRSGRRAPSPAANPPFRAHFPVPVTTPGDAGEHRSLTGQPFQLDKEALRVRPAILRISASAVSAVKNHTPGTPPPPLLAGAGPDEEPPPELDELLLELEDELLEELEELELEDELLERAPAGRGTLPDARMAPA